MKHKLFPSLIICLLIISCKGGPLKGYKKIANTFGYRFVTDLDTGTTADSGILLFGTGKIFNEKDSVVNDPQYENDGSFSLKMTLLPPNYPYDLMHAFQKLSDGDSVIIKMVADTFYAAYNMNRPLPANVKSGSYIQFHLKVHNILNDQEYDEYLEQQQFLDKAAAYRFFHDYLEAVGVTDQAIGSGIVISHIREGKGKAAIPGDSVRINFIMMTFEGAELANTYAAGMPYDFVVGSGAVVSGLNEALTYMKKDSKARVYIPYYSAYGIEGVDGIVPPFSHLVIDVEVLEIFRRR